MPKHSIGENDNNNNNDACHALHAIKEKKAAAQNSSKFLTLSPSSSPRLNLNKTQKPRPQTPKFLRLRPQQKLKKDQTNLLQANPRRLPEMQRQARMA